MIRTLGRHLRTQFVGYVALAVALSGTAYAVGANSIGDRELAPNSVGSSEIEPDSVKRKDIAPGAVGADELDSIMCYVGEILQVGFDYAPPGTLPADGRLLPVNGEYDALFSLYGGRFGGDEVHNFGIPKLAGTDGTSYLVCVDGIYPPRD